MSSLSLSVSAGRRQAPALPVDTLVVRKRAADGHRAVDPRTLHLLDRQHDLAVIEQQGIAA